MFHAITCITMSQYHPASCNRCNAISRSSHLFQVHSCKNRTEQDSKPILGMKQDSKSNSMNDTRFKTYSGNEYFWPIPHMYTASLMLRRLFATLLKNTQRYDFGLGLPLLKRKGH